jgi:hypothetical protein
MKVFNIGTLPSYADTVISGSKGLKKDIRGITLIYIDTLRMQNKCGNILTNSKMLTGT